MSTSATSSTELGDGLPANGGVDPWWKRWGKRQSWQDDLYRKAAHKTLDIPEDDMQINANKFGVGTLGIIGAALAGGLPALGIAWLLSRRPEPKIPTAPPPVERPDTDTQHRWTEGEWR
jgi:hypothetical protein